jgi:hypothetical protein
MNVTQRLNQIGRTAADLQLRVAGLDALQRQGIAPQGASPPAQRPTIVGRTDAATPMRPATIVEAKDLQQLGFAVGRTWYAYPPGELRIDAEVPSLALHDNLPPDRLIVHAVEQLPEQTVDEADPAKPWRKSERKHLPAQAVDRYWRATLLETGSYVQAVERDRAAQARNQARADSAPNRALRRERAAARMRWLNGSTAEPRELLGFDCRDEETSR